MVFGITKKDRRVPDLSRYDYYYQNKDDYNKSPQLSAAAAYAASTGTSPSSRPRTQPLRSQSMIHNTGYEGSKVRSQNRVSSGSVLRAPQQSSTPNYRSYSLRSQGSGHPRKNSIISNNNALAGKPTARTGNGSGSRANSITVKTTEVRDLQGRTQSITRKTVRRVNGYEYVETTTTTTKAVPIVDPEKHFDEFSGNYIIQDDGIEELSEEEDAAGDAQSEVPPSNSKSHAYTALTGPSAGLTKGLQLDNEVPLDQTSSMSQFSDALEYVPNESRRKKRPLHANQNPRSRNAARGKKSDSLAKTEHRHHNQHAKKTLTEQEMYAKALAIAQKNVYKDDDQSSRSTSQENRMSTMGKRTLRSSASSNSVLPANIERTPSKSKTFGSFFQRNNKTQDVVPTALTSSSDANSKRSKSDEEMYAQALAIAQGRYNQAHSLATAPVGPEISTKNINTSSEPATKTASATTHGNVSTSAKTNLVATPDAVVKTVEAEQRNMGPVPGAILSQENGSSENEQKISTEREEQGSDVFERHEGTTATKATTPEAFTADTEYENQLDPPHPMVSSSTTNKSTSSSAERKFTFKNVFDKMKQFSKENSGYQSPKKSQGKSVEKEQNTSTLPHPVDEINIVRVKPMRRTSSVSIHGAATTKSVESPLTQTAPPLNDQGSDSSFQRSRAASAANTKLHGHTSRSLRESLRDENVEPTAEKGKFFQKSPALAPPLQDQVERSAAAASSNGITQPNTIANSDKKSKKEKSSFIKKLFKRS